MLATEQSRHWAKEKKLVNPSLCMQYTSIHLGLDKFFIFSYLLFYSPILKIFYLQATLYFFYSIPISILNFNLMSRNINLYTLSFAP